MRFARILACLAPLLVLVSLPSSWHFVPRAAANPAPADSGAAPDSFLTIYTMKGEHFDVRYVSPWTMDTVRFQKVSGEIGYLAANKILSIEDQARNDRLDEMLRTRSSFGVPPVESRSLGDLLKRPFYSKPERERARYLVLEVGMSTRANGGHTTGESGTLFVSGIGGIKNVSPRWGVGGVAQFAAGSDDYRAVAAGIRIRHYLNETFTLETTHGLFGDRSNQSRDQSGIPYFGEVALSAAGTVSVFTRLERHGYTIRRYLAGFYPVESEISDTALHFGIRLGPRPGYLTVPGAIVGFLFALSPGARELY